MRRFRQITFEFLGGFLLLFSTLGFGAVTNSTGTPLGGIGAGGVKYWASEGTFSFNDRGAPCKEHDFKFVPGMRFQFFTNEGGEPRFYKELEAVSDDGTYPIHSAVFDTLNHLQIKLKAFAPVDFKEVSRMCYPYAFFEFTITNQSSQEKNFGWAFAVETPGEASTIHDNGLLWYDTLESKNQEPDRVERAAMVEVSADNYEITLGGGEEFQTTGKCLGSPGVGVNRLAAFATAAAGETVTIRFVLSWYMLSYEGSAGYPERYYYTKNLFGAEDAAMSGLEWFGELKENAYGLVGRLRASSLPTWFSDQLLVSLSVLVTNSWYTRDGRFCFAEGNYDPNGTMDQMWHSRQMINHLLPSLSTQEMRYWASTQKTNPVGQIHHDFGQKRNLYSWDNRQHGDYRNIDKWVDLNAGFIISVYELVLVDGNTALLEELWPATKKAAQRMIDQLTDYHDNDHTKTYSGTQSTYDSNGHEADHYNTGLASVAFKIAAQFAERMDDTEFATTCNQLHPVIDEQFVQRWLKPESPFELFRGCENVITGQWIAHFLKMDDLYPKEDLDFGINRLIEHYQPATQFGVYRDWQHYVVSHLGGILLQTGIESSWMFIQKHMAETNNEQAPYNQQLYGPGNDENSISSRAHYLTAPVVWRNYYELIGLHHNGLTYELYLTPKLSDAFGHSISDAPFVLGTVWGKMSIEESGENYRNCSITFTPEKEIAVGTLYLRDKFSEDRAPLVLVDGQSVSYSRIGSGYNRLLEVDLDTKVTSDGMMVYVGVDPVAAGERSVLRADKKLLIRKGAVRFYDVRGRSIGTSEIDFTGIIIRHRDGQGVTRVLNAVNSGKRNMRRKSYSTNE